MTVSLGAFGLSGKVVIVTGANRGNGLAIANGLTEQGAVVIRIDKEFDAEQKNLNYIQFDISELDKIPQLVLSIYKKYGKIDGLVNNAGISVSSEDPWGDMESYFKTLEVNLSAPFLLSSHVCKLMVTGNISGSIVNVTSLSSVLGFEGNPSYQISKAGLSQLTRSIARSFGGKLIRANNLCPGYIKTNMTIKSFEDPKLSAERMGRMILNRWGESRDLVGAVLFLMSDHSSYITGADIPVDGGWLANGM